MDARRRAAATANIRARFLRLQGSLSERARRLLVANEAIACGYGGIAAAARATGMAPSVIGRGMGEVRAIEAGTAAPLDPRRSRFRMTAIDGGTGEVENTAEMVVHLNYAGKTIDIPMRWRGVGGFPAAEYPRQPSEMWTGVWEVPADAMTGSSTTR